MTSELLSLMIAEGQRDTPSIAYERQVGGLAVDAPRNLIPRCTVQISWIDCNFTTAQRCRAVVAENTGADRAGR
jgi:hypothetical protein